MEVQYYEVHVTIAPDFDRLELAQRICDDHIFHMGKLLMRKKTEEGHRDDMFFTTRTETYDQAVARTLAFIHELRDHTFKVWRYKIEATYMDSKINDTLMVLDI